MLGKSFFTGMGSIANGFSGGRLQLGLNFSTDSGDYPFINVLKYSDSLFWGQGSLALAPTDMDSNGYPTTLASGSVTCRTFVPNQTDKPGNWKVTWDGNGTLGISVISGVTGGTLNPTTVSGGLTSPANNSYTFSFDNTGPGSFAAIDLSITALGSPGVSNIKLYHINDETDLLAGKYFTSKFISKIKEGKLGVIRFMNWQPINNSNATNWAYRKPISYWNWYAYQQPPELYAGVSTNSSNTYAVSVPGTLKHSSDGTTWTNGDAPKDKDTITVKWNATASNAAATIQVGTGGSSSAITMKDPIINDLSSAGNSLCLINHISSLTFDADLNCWIKWGGDSTGLGDHGIRNGVPIEVCLQLCKEVGAHPWFCLPQYALDPMTDYTTQLATYIKNNMLTWMVPRFECVNEVWNPLFVATYYGGNKAKAHWSLGNINDYHNWMGKVNSTAAQDVNAVFGGSATAATKYHFVVGVQTGTGNTVTACGTSDPRATSALYFAQAAAAQGGYVKDHAYNWVTHVTPANYFNGAYSGGITVPYEGTLATALNASRLKNCSVSSGTLTLSTVDVGPALTTGLTLFGQGVPAGVTITGGSGTTWTLSNSGFSIPASTYLYTYSDFTAAQKYVDTLNTQAVFTANNTNGTNILTVTATTSPTTGVGSIMQGMLLNYNDPNCFNNAVINAYGTDGTTGTGGTGTYSLDKNPFGGIASQTVKGSWLFDTNFIVNVYLTNWKAWAQGFGINRMAFYEGGYSPDYSSVVVNASDLLRNLSKYVYSSPNKTNGLQDHMTDLWNNCIGLSGGGFTVEFPSVYEFTANYPDDAVWSVLNTIYQSPDSPQWNAIKAF